MNTQDSLPWYRYPFVWFALSIPLSAVIAGIGMIYLAVSTDDGLVADDYYKKGLAINRSIKRERFAADMGISADFEYDSELQRVLLQLNRGQLADYPQTLIFNLQHATRAEHDVQLELMHGMDNQYVGLLKKQLPAGVWHAELITEEWRIGARINLSSQSTIQLRPEIFEPRGTDL